MDVGQQERWKVGNVGQQGNLDTRDLNAELIFDLNNFTYFTDFKLPFYIPNIL